MSTRTFSSLARRGAHALIALAMPVLLVLSPLATNAATDAELAAKVRECSDIRRDKSRLRCFDDALRPPAAVDAATTSAADSSAPASTTAAAEPAPVPPASEDFGREQIEAPPEKPKPPRQSTQIEAVVAALDKRRDGLLTIALDNEQIWRQKAVTPLFRLRVGDTVKVKKGRFGGYTLVAPGRKSTAVVRIE